MELAFSDKKVRNLCLNEFLAKEELGAPVAEKLKSRLADLHAAAFVVDVFMLPGRLRELSDDRWGQLVMDLANGQQLTFQSGHLKMRLLPSGEIDWSRVRRVKILGLETGHE